MALHLIRLELGRSRDFPDGSRNRGYEIKAPLTPDGRLDEKAWRTVKEKCTVRRFWPDEDDQEGRLIHTRHRTWALSYEPGEDDDTPFYHLESHQLALGEYVSILEQDGRTLTFRVANVSPLKTG
jgi:hypothetical protein